MSETFLDTFFLLAVFNPSDAAHTKAVDTAKTFRGTLVTTDWVLTEVADALSDPSNRSRCVELIDDLRKNPSVVVESASRSLFERGWALYRDRPDKGWSLTDCISFVVMRERGIHEALTGDHHYTQAGFRAIM
jgi:predicted nucleic acid-binding protein